MIHQFTHNDTYITLDIASGAVHVMDEVGQALCALLTPPLGAQCPEEVRLALDGRFCEQDITAAYGELYTLFCDGILFSEDTELPQSLIKPKNTPVKALCLHVSHDCNLRCKYCFAQTGDFGTKRSLMTPEVAQKAIDFVIARSGNRRNIEIDFFGGEPLMALDTVKHTVAYANARAAEAGKVFRFTMTTNGVLLDDALIDYLNEEMSNVVLSLDGRESVNDAMRPTINGKGSYAHILPKFQKLVQRRAKDKDYYVRGTYTAHNLDFMEDILDMYRQGFDQISVEPVSAPEGCGYELSAQHLPTIRREYWALAEKMLEMEQTGDGFCFFHFLVDLEQGPCIIKRLRGCGAGCEYVAVTPEGDLYPCHQFVGQSDFLLGNVVDGSFDTEKTETFAGVNVYTRPDCRTCWAKYYCSGGCSAANFFAHGDINACYELGCELEKMRLECAIYMAAQRAMRDE